MRIRTLDEGDNDVHFRSSELVGDDAARLLFRHLLLVKHLNDLDRILLATPAEVDLHVDTARPNQSSIELLRMVGSNNLRMVSKLD